MRLEGGTSHLKIIVADGRISVVGVLRYDEIDGVYSVDDSSIVRYFGIHHFEVDAFFVDSIAACRPWVHLEDLNLGYVRVKEHVVLVSVVELGDNFKTNNIIGFESSLDAFSLSLYSPSVHRQTIVLVLEVTFGKITSIESITHLVVIS